MSTGDGRFDGGPAGPVRVADFDALDEPDEAGSTVRVASFDLDDDGGASGDGGGPDGGTDGGSGEDSHDGADEDPEGRAGGPFSEFRTVDLDGDPDVEGSPEGRVVSFDDALDAGPDVVTRQARFDGTIPADRRESRDGVGRRGGSGRPRRGRGDRDGSAPVGSARDGTARSGTAPDRAAADGPGPGGAGPGGQGPDDDASGGASTRGRRGRRGRRTERRADAGPAPDDETRAKEICLRLLTDRARTVKELRDALLRKEVPDDVADRVLERFDEVGLVDDEAFAGQWVRSRHQHRGLGRRAIAQELRRKGVAKEIADEALTEIDAESEEARARELVDRKIRTVKVGTREERAAASRRLVGMLARKGYGAGVAYSVVREAIAARGAEEDELGEEPPED